MTNHHVKCGNPVQGNDFIDRTDALRTVFDRLRFSEFCLLLT